MKYARQKTDKATTRARMIHAALILWERYGELGVSARAVGNLCGCSGQRVHKVFGNMAALRQAAAQAAVMTDRKVIIAQMQAAGHPLAPPMENRPLL